MGARSHPELKTLIPTSGPAVERILDQFAIVGCKWGGKTFHSGHAFFPGDSVAWDTPWQALKPQMDSAAFEKMRGSVSFRCKPGEQKRLGLKPIDWRGHDAYR
jgi:hypothetical protein